MTCRSRTGLVALTTLSVALLLVSATVVSGAFVGGAAATPSGSSAAADGALGDGSDATDDRVDPPTRCFAGEGYPISIGDGGAAIEALVHLSVLTDPTAGNEFGLEAAGTLDGEPIVTLGAGVRLTAREAIANGVDPFAAFDVLYAYELRLPMFDGSIGDSEYRDEGSPIDSGAGAVPC
ncbi:DUF7332 family protein [Halorubrum lacusprofundi]|jgi:hypothetical protein|uniref:Uncharacterized protein n=1 Tax=Halorubrum lacusprofundi (strain ATCC 49239 / DSM 5036 / JCM 8891 / ACAM 34) TaxID=416348 RepID=B9LMH8_HALLT|nr:hypothetical protein [Halorubrum lacusprofundi]ACM56566.1 hypothetical protein Hlac_0968 [Halorubrum lacusprofundi ATCC 49239]MCG1005167.1 hypothetical protein [Halorubrum lacusprofundi]